MMMVPANFNGTVFLHSHAFRPNIPIPAGIPGYGGYTVTNTPEPVPGGNTTIASHLLGKGYAIVGSGFARQGWNIDSAIKTNVELIGVFKKQFSKTTKVVAWGNSMGGGISQALAEKYPDLIDAHAALCTVSDPSQIINYGGDVVYGIKAFFDPTIKGGSYSAGAAGYAEAMGDIVKIFTAVGALQAAILANPTNPAWPATSKVPDAIKAAIPSRSALVLIALMAGMPLQSAHFDSTSTPPGAPANVAFGAQNAVYPSLAALENMATAAALGVLVLYDLELQTGGNTFDNTKTDYAARVADEKDIWSLALSGNTATATLLGYLASVPKVTAQPAAVEKLKTLVSHTGQTAKPSILFKGIADPATLAGMQQSLADKYSAYLADQWAKGKKAGDRKRPTNNQLVLWNFTPEKYMKFTAAGTPDTSAPAATGTNHCNFTINQYLAIADLLAYAAENGKNMSGGALLTKLRKAGNMSFDRKFVAPRLKALGE